MKDTVITMSWDDGHPLDLRLADLLAKYGFNATFYIPGRVAPGGCGNPQGFAVLPPAELRSICRKFELGSHTLDHRFLDNVPVEEARRQVISGKEWLEDQLGERVAGFCYPGGKHNPEVRQIVREAGFRYARTTEDLIDHLPEDLLQLPVTVQFYPRGRKDVISAFVREEGLRAGAGRWRKRLPIVWAAISRRDFSARLKAMLERVCRTGGIFHLWGHAWEVDRLNGWGVLEEFLRFAAERVPPAARLSNSEVVSLFLGETPDQSSEAACVGGAAMGSNVGERAA